MKQRDSYFDNVKFILITLVILGHIIEPLNNGQTFKPLYLWIYSFHMPLFVFITGYFSKNIHSSDYFNKVISKLMLPYLFFETFYSLFDFWIFKKDKLEFSYLTPYWIMWFLFSMILWKVALPYAVKIRYALPISIALAILAGYANDIGYYGSLSRTIVFFPFFLSGYYFDKQYLERFMTRKFRIISLVIIGLSFLAFFQFGHGISVQWLYGSFSYEALHHKEWYAGIYRIMIYLIAAIMCLCVLILAPPKQIPVISKLGKNTLYPYLIHGFVMKYLIYCGFYSHFSSTWIKGFLILIGIAISLLLSMDGVRNIFRWIVEPRWNFLFKGQTRDNVTS
ncbi:acyltransferase family protein [Paenibacillus sp. OAS669]|uniref:acyltransferase family protein n=1 Tax=Paenibacillus sp. OAS669 TaxID=2663821 RepID=UPI00178C0212|nr:acyltransferase family protein [Paenibacillus sp. OAS669]MBE1445660.1 fucose 4-O-acetylase-like acetyltransferase [Paenibacillus sp. OAS669]